MQAAERIFEGSFDMVDHGDAPELSGIRVVAGGNQVARMVASLDCMACGGFIPTYFAPSDTGG